MPSAWTGVPPPATFIGVVTNAACQQHDILNNVMTRAPHKKANVKTNKERERTMSRKSAEYAATADVKPEYRVKPPRERRYEAAK